MDKADQSNQTALTVADHVRIVAAEFDASELSYGHGTESALDEAAYLVFAVLGLSHDDTDAEYAKRVGDSDAGKISELARRRIDERIPVAYLVGRAWFAGHEFVVDPRVLIPRSPFAELISADFEPWLADRPLRRALDLGTGCGCIAVAIALQFSQSRVDAVDVSADALAVARINVERYDLSDRVRLIQSDFFASLPNGGDGMAYDLIIGNPPYVDATDMAQLQAEFRHEPELGLASGIDGLDSVITILHDASKFLNAGGILLLEVGNSQASLERRFPRIGFLWLDFALGGSGVFLLTSEQLQRHQSEFDRAYAEMDQLDVRQ